MGIIDKIKGNPFDKLKMDDLTAEKVILDREEKLKIAEVEKLSAQKKELFSKGFDSTEGTRRALSRQIHQLDQKIKLDNVQLKKISDQICLVDNLVFIQENKEALERKGLVGKLLKMPKSKLAAFLAQVNVREQINAGTLESMLSTMEAEYGLVDSELQDGKETKKLMDIWASTDVAQADEVYEKWDKEKSDQKDLDLEAP